MVGRVRLPFDRGPLLWPPQLLFLLLQLCWQPTAMNFPVETFVMVGVFKLLRILWMELVSWRQHFLLAQLIKDWHRAGLQAKMKAQGIHFRPRPLPAPLFVLPHRWMVLTAVMMSMWSVAMAGHVPQSPPVTWVEALEGVRGLDPLLPQPKKPPDPVLLPSTAGEGEEKKEINQLSETDLQELKEIDTMFCQPCGTKPAPVVSEMKACAAIAGPSFGLVGMLSHLTKHEAIVDSGATFSITPHQSDFIEYAEEQGEVLKGISAGCAIAGRGTILWRLEVGNKTIDLKLHALHVPQAEARLLCPQQVMREHKPEPIDSKIKGQSIDLLFAEAEGVWLECPLNSALLPVVTVSTPNEIESDLKCLHACVIQENNQNLTLSQKELLRWHCKLGHLSFQRVQKLMKTGALGWHPKIKAAANLDLNKSPLMCGSCAYGKAKRKPHRPKTQKQPDSAPPKMAEKLLSKDVLIPGQRVSMDHFIVSTPGRLFSSRGREAHDRMFKGGVIFVDHASGFVQVVPVVNFTAGEAIRAKREFESEMASMGITVLNYHSDNGVFTASAFQDELANMKQDLTLSGVGAHHQNSVAERMIGVIGSMSRTMLLHAKMRWPKGIDPSLWPMAMKQAEFLHNHVPNLNNVCPMDLVLKTVVPRHQLRNIHVWGAPTYVLDPKLQDGHKVPKFDPRSRRGVNLGWSPKHASSVPLVLNLDSGHVSPQFHVVFDDWFSTVSSDGEAKDDELESPEWINMFSNERFQVALDPDEDIELNEEWLTEMERLEKHQRAADRMANQLPTVAQQSNEKPMTNGSTRQPTETLAPAASAPPNRSIEVPAAVVQPPAAASQVPALAVTPTESNNQPNRRDKEKRRAEIDESNILPPNQRRTRRPTIKGLFCSGLLAVSNAPIVQMARQLSGSPAALLAMNGFNAVTETFDQVDWFSFQAATAPRTKGKKGQDPDFPTLQQAMRSPDWDEWRESLNKEIKTLTEMGTWTVVPRSVATAKGAKVIKSTWALRIKRNPMGFMTKRKSRLCVRGDLETPEDYGESFSPVVQWSSVRLMLILSIVHGLHTRQVDYVNAFAQADLTREVFMELPQGVEHMNDEDCILQLHKSLYGMSDAPLMFFELLKKNLESVGFHQMKTLDPCLFVHKNAICLTYVDDCLWFGRDAKQLDKLIEEMKGLMDLTIESNDVSAFLGIQFTREGETITLTQKGLIEKILKTMGMENCNADKVPAEHKPLGKDVNGPPMKEEWNFASVVGMFLYLSGNSRPDIAFAVNQAARFTHSPKQSHAQALKRIARYLQGTKDRGLTFKPSKEWKVDAYSDADFCGLWGSEDPDDPIVTKSRTGFVILLAGCPLLWKSTLQTETSVSTMMAEYVALSSTMRELLPLKRLVKTVAKIVTGDDNVVVTSKSDFYEDNNGALTVATMPRITPQSKFFAVKLHFFKEHVKTQDNPSGEVEIQKVDTNDQLADIFTKGLVPDKFEPLRDRLMGWDLQPNGSRSNFHSRGSVENVRLVRPSEHKATDQETVKFRGYKCSTYL